MARWALGFLVGVMFIMSLSTFPSLEIMGWLAVASMLLMVCLFFRVIAFSYGVLLLAFCLGFLWAWLNIYYALRHQFPRALEGQTLLAQGNIIDIPEHYPNHLRFDFLIQSIETQVPINYPLHVRLYWYGRGYMGKPPRLRKGDSWQFALRLKRPRAFWSPGSFDYQSQLWQENVQATGYIIDKMPFYLLQQASSYFFVDRLRERLTDTIKRQLSGNPLVGLIVALTTGMRDAISDAEWRVMRGTGTNHLFAISGLHLAFIAGSIYAIVRFLWCRFPYAALLLPAPQVAAVFTLLCALFYSALAGFSLPTQRALLMLSIVLLAALQRRYLTAFYSVYLALLLILIKTPFSVLSPSFWLSFIAIAFIFYANAGRIKAFKTWQAWLGTQLAVGLGLIPLSLLFFHQISWVGFVANLFAIPWISFLVLPMSLLGSFMALFSPVLGGYLLNLAAYLVGLLWYLLTYLSEIPYLQYYSFVFTSYLLFSSFLGLLLLLAPKGIPARYLGFICLLPLFFWKPKGPKSGEVWLSLLDVGQGLAVVVRTHNHVLLYDTGPRWSTSFEAGKAVVLPFLWKMGIKKLDMLMISHGDSDHSGGVDAILKQIPVSVVVSSLKKLKNGFSSRISLCQEKMHWQWDSVSFDILYPPSNKPYSGNNSSCVLKVSYLAQSILLTGDIEKIAEDYLVKFVDTNLLKSTLLIVPHHGSKTSSSIAFLNKVQPAYALFATGYHNRFKFPHSIVLRRYQRLNTRIYDTASDGTITVKLSPLSKSVQVETYIRKYHRFWLNQE